MRGNVAQRLPVKHDVASIRLEETCDHVQGRGLATARGTQQGDELPLAHLQVQLVEGCVFTI